MLGYGALIVGIIAIVYSAIIFIIQRHTQLKNNFKEKQKIIKEKQKIISNIYKTKDIKDTDVKKDLDLLQKEVMKLNMDMMKGNFKNMIWIMIISLVVFGYIATFSNYAYPVGKFLGLSEVFVWYIIISLVANIFFKLIFSVLEKKGVLSENYG